MRHVRPWCSCRRGQQPGATDWEWAFLVPECRHLVRRLPSGLDAHQRALRPWCARLGMSLGASWFRRARRSSSVSANAGIGGSGVERSTGSGPQLQRSRPEAIRSDMPAPRRGSCGFFTGLPAASFSPNTLRDRPTDAAGHAVDAPTERRSRSSFLESWLSDLQRRRRHGWRMVVSARSRRRNRIGSPATHGRDLALRRTVHRLIDTGWLRTVEKRPENCIGAPRAVQTQR
jgi:hypothetical protein